jgi:hypothetical protein
LGQSSARSGSAHPGVCPCGSRIRDRGREDTPTGPSNSAWRPRSRRRRLTSRTPLLILEAWLLPTPGSIKETACAAGPFGVH